SRNFCKCNAPAPLCLLLPMARAFVAWLDLTMQEPVSWATRTMDRSRMDSKRGASEELVSPPSKRARTPEHPEVARSHDPAILCLSGDEDGKSEQKLTANDINDALARISRNILESTESLLAFLGLQKKRSIDSPCVRAPSDDLRRLYEACWGLEWFNMEKQLEPHEGLSASNVIRALTACYVYHFAFGDAPAGHDELCSTCDVTSLAGKQPAEKLFFALASADESERVRAMADKDNLPTQPSTSSVPQDQCTQSTFDAHTAASRLADILHPHIGNLVRLAEALQKFEGEADGWCADFVDSMTSVLCASSELKCRLISSNYKHDFFWPTSGSVVDTAAMKLAHRLPACASQEVAFTLFPGIHVDFGLSRSSWTVRTADVVPRLQANNVDEHVLM
ncbi:hypothetical protein AC579_7405, partial [Pseudocercospora musae]